MKSHTSLAYSLMWRGGGWTSVRDAQLSPHPQQSLERGTWSLGCGWGVKGQGELESSELLTNGTILLNL